MGWKHPTIRSLFIASAAFAANASAVWGNVPPVYVPQQNTVILRKDSLQVDINLRGLFRDPDVPGSAARIFFRLGTEVKSLDIALFDATKPITVANFQAYTNAG